MPYAIDLVGGTEIVDIFLVGGLHVVIHNTRIAHHLGIAQPTALLTTGAILGESVIVGTEGIHHDGLQTIHILA